MKSPGDFLRNLRRGEMSLSRRLRLIAASYARRLVRRETCCGLPGTPGC